MLRKAADPAGAERAPRGGEVGPAPVATDQGTSTHVRPGRVGKANVTGYFDPEVKRQLRIIAAEGNTTIQELLVEALNDLFAKRGKSEIAK